MLQRVEEVKELQDEVSQLRADVQPLLRNRPPKQFIKGDGKGNDSDVNKWGVRNAYR